MAERQSLTPTAPQVRGSLARRVRRLRGESWNIGQTTLAAGAAWIIAGLIHSQPFFAPVAAVISLGTATGRRSRRAIELSVGVAVGIGVADLIVRALGSSSLVLMAVVALSMSAALLLGAGVLLVNQAAVSAIIAVATVTPGTTPSPYRALDALIGGAIALLVGQVLFPRDPIKMMQRAAQPIVKDLSSALELTAGSLRDGDVQGARRALALARDLDADLAGFYDAVALARETFVMRRPGRRTRERLPLYAEAAQQMDYAVRNTRVLARRTVAAVRRHGAAPHELADAVSLLAQAVLELGTQLDDPERDVSTRRLALEAAVQATSILDADPGLSHAVIIGQVRSTAVDLLRGSGLSSSEAADALETASRKAGAPT